MSQNKLTTRKIELIKAVEKELNIGDGGGLWLRVNPVAKGGAKSFYYRYSYDGKARRLGFGEFPGLTLAEARAMRDKAKAALLVGRNPGLFLSVEAGAYTVRMLFNAWRDAVLIDHKDNGKKIESHFVYDVFPAIGDKPAGTVTHDDIILLLERVVKRGAKAKASKLLSWLRALFGFGIRRRIVSADPTAHLRARDIGAKEGEGTRTLSFDELKILGEALPVAGLPVRVQAAVWIMLGAGCRPVELYSAKPQNLDLKARFWTLPKTKNNSEFLIYLSDFLLAQFKILLRYSTDEWLLAGRDPRKHVSEDYLRKMIGERIATVKRKKSTPLCGALALPGGRWTIYDLRRTFASRLGDLGIDPHIIEACLNHKPPGVKGIYQRQLYANERREALIKWGDYLTVIASCQDSQ